MATRHVRPVTGPPEGVHAIGRAIHTEGGIDVNRFVAAYRRGGLTEVVRAVRRAVAKAIYPGPLPSPTPPRKKARKSSAAPKKPKLDARTVSHAEALAFFDRRRDTYVELARSVEPFLKPGGLVLDVGGNIGYFSRTMIDVTAWDGRIELFEPMPTLAALARQTLTDLGDRVRIHEFGLGESDATLTLHVAGDGNLGWNTLIGGKTQSNMQQVQIQVRAFDSLGLDEAPCLVKIDVEGAEAQVLLGMMGALERWTPRPALLCEIGWGQSHPDWEKELAVFDRLAALGYRPQSTSGEPVELAALTKTSDVLFIPPGHVVRG